MRNIVKETNTELKKVVWPSAKDVGMGTLSVVVISGLIGAYIVLADMCSFKLVELITNGVSGLIG